MSAKLVQDLLLRFHFILSQWIAGPDNDPVFRIHYDSFWRRRYPIAGATDAAGFLSAVEWYIPPNWYMEGFTYGTNEIPDSFDFAYFTPSRVDDIGTELRKLRPPENADVWTAVAIDTNGPSTKFMTGIWLEGGLSKDLGGTLTHSNGLFRFSDPCGGGDMDCWRKTKLKWIRKE
ncbi:MAG: hypothetical protein IJ678_03950 [Kiritimatiellae bacterium]|nr:hypothetical protein [Kiritimatiellia bacterium]